MEKLLTIVVPVYNTEKYLVKCLKSLLVSKYLDKIEVLVIIDGSPDNSVKIAKKFESEYPHTFIVIEKENGGHGSTINKGLELATGKYFKVLDSDDWFDEVNFETFLDKLSAATEDVVMTHLMREYTSIGKSVLWGNDKIKYDYSYTEFSVLKFLTINFFGMGRCTYKTRKLKEYNLRLLEKRSFEDTFLHVFPLLFMRSFVFYNMVVYHYYLERPDQSVKQKVTIKQCNDWCALVEQITVFYSVHKDKLSIEKRVFVLRALKQYINRLYITLNNLSYCEAKKELRSYNAFVSTLPFYSDVKGLKSRCYNLVPYLAFRTAYSMYTKIRVAFFR